VDRRAAARRPLSAPEPGLFGPASITWRLDREAFLLLGAGPRALLMQIAHPAVAAGVADHSNFRADPWTRLAATLRSYLRIVYGTTDQARAEVHRLNRLHGGVQGVVPGGGAYHGRDPALALWVHATLVDSTLTTAHAWLRPLDRQDRARAYEESVPIGRLFGIAADRLPADLAAFEDYMTSMLADDGPVQPGRTAKDLAAAILSPPAGPALRTILGSMTDLIPTRLLGPAESLGDRVPAAATAWLLWPSIGLLPPRLREAYGLPWSPLERAVAAWLVASWRAWNAVLPPFVREMPQARAADRRIASTMP